MSFGAVTPSTPVTGQFASIYLLRGAAAAFAGSGLVPKPNQARNSYNFPPGTLYGLSDRAKKIIDPTLTPAQIVVKNNGALVQPYQYQHLGGGDIVFNTAPTLTGTAEVQSLAVTGTPTSAVIPLGFGGVTINLAYTAATTAAQVQAALVALPTIGPGGVIVTGAAGGPFAITFAGPLATGPQPLITTVGATFVAGTAPAATVTETTAGTDTLTMDAAAISTSGTWDQFPLSETVDFVMTPTSTMVKSNVYGQVADREFPSFIGTKFTFMGNEVDNILFSYQMQGRVAVLAAFESTKSVPPRIWILAGYFDTNPVDAKGGGMVSGQRSFGTIQLPYYVGETL